MYRINEVEFFPNKINRNIALIGHPRFGSGYISKVITAAGFNIGHEYVKEYGAASWMYAVHDWCYPYGDAHASQKFSFDAFYTFIRNPIKALPSCIVENTSKISFEFRRQHIYKNFGVDLNDFSNSADRAGCSIIYWYKLCEAKNPISFVRIDDPNHVGLFLNGIGVHDEVKIEEALKLPPSNTASQKWGGENKTKPLSKKVPKLSIDLEKDMSIEIKDRLFLLGQAYGYSPEELDFVN